MRTFAWTALVIAACGPGGGALPDATSAAVDGAAADAAPTTDAIVRVHYPAAGHAMAIRGGGAGLDWTTGAAMAAGSDATTFTFAFPALAQPIEWKPLLDDATWSRGPNYHVAPGQTLDVYPHFTQTAGQVVTLIADFHSTTLGNDRAIYAYLPASYAENTAATYPVVYFHDGQNLWAALSDLAFSTPWNVDTTFDAAAESGTCSGWGAQPLGSAARTCTGDGDCAAGETCETFPEAIAIGVANTDARIYEYTPTIDPTETDLGSAGGAAQYLAMLVDELKPAIDAQLRTRPDAASTAMIGSSLGGLVTAYAGIGHADVFSRLGELSPSTWWDDDVIVGDVEAAGMPRPAIVYVDSGAGSADDETDTDQLAAAYLAQGYTDGATFRHVVQPDASHSEIYWAERLPGALQLLLGRGN